MEKTKVYEGYEEKYVTGKELKDLFPDEFIAEGKHHSEIKNISVRDYLEIINIKDDQSYRIFINEYFCRIMNADTDKLVNFFSYSSLDNARIINNLSEYPIELVCSECGRKMKYKEGKYGSFLGCSGYPECRHACKIKTIGYGNDKG